MPIAGHHWFCSSLSAMICLGILTVGVNPALAADWALRVTAIAGDGAPAPEAGIEVIEGQGGGPRTVQVGDAFPLGVVLVTPARVTLTLESGNGNRITLMPGSRLRLSSGSGRGEEYGLDTGKARFLVKKALDFFNVRHDTFQALVRGTDYSVEVVPRQEIRFAVATGAVKIEREAKIFIEEGQKEGQVTVAEYLAAGEEKPYRLSHDEYLARYTHFGEAEEHYRKQLAADRASRDPERLHDGLLAMGNILVVLSRYQEAAGIYEELLPLVRGLHPDGLHNDIAMVLTNLGVAYGALGGTENLHRAIGYYEEALKIKRQFFPGGIHNDIASILNNLGVAYRNLGGTENLHRTIGYHEEALKIRRQLFPGGIHNDIARVLTNLGVAYQNLGGTENLHRAIECYEEALKIMRQLFPGGIHNDIASILNNLGVAYGALGGTENLHRAIGYFEEALKIKRQLSPDDNHDAFVTVIEALKKP